MSQSTKYPELAAKAAFELAKGMSKSTYQEKFGLPAWKINYEDNDLGSLYRKAAKFGEAATSCTNYLDSLMDGEPREKYYYLLRQLYLCKITPEEFTQAMDEELN